MACTILVMPRSHQLFGYVMLLRLVFGCWRSKFNTSCLIWSSRCLNCSLSYCTTMSESVVSFGNVFIRATSPLVTNYLPPGPFRDTNSPLLAAPTGGSLLLSNNRQQVAKSEQRVIIALWAASLRIADKSRHYQIILQISTHQWDQEQES